MDIESLDNLESVPEATAMHRAISIAQNEHEVMAAFAGRFHSVSWTS